MRNLDELKADLTRKRDGFTMNTTTGRLFDQALKAITDLQIEVNQAAATTVYVIPGHHRWGDHHAD